MADRLHVIVAELLPDFPFERRILVGFSVVGQCLYYRQNRPVGEVLFGRAVTDHFTADVLADHIASLTLAGLGKGPTLHAGAAS